MADWENNPVSRFLATFPTQLQCSETEYFFHRRVFWTRNSSSNDDDDDDRVIHDKIKSAFSDDSFSPLKGILQFWAIETSGGRRVLSSSDQPFTFAYLNSGRRKYRLSCIKYRYNIDDVNKVEVGEDPMIISGPPATAFLNRFPVVVDLTTVKQDSPLVRSALECDLTYSLLLPVFYPSLSSCVGVVECSVKPSGLSIFYYLQRALEKVGLSTYHVQESQPYKRICGLGRATHEIEEAFEIVCESHGLTLAQVWFRYENENHFPDSSSLEETYTKKVFAVKLIGYRDVSDDDRSSVVKNYYDACDILPLKLGEGLAGKTLQTYEPHFCQNLYKVRHNGLLGQLSADTKCSCLTLCLRSIDTGDLDYAFEFLWPHNRNCSLMLDSLLSNLKRCLPSFKFSSGAEFGDELRVLDVGNSTGSGNQYFKTLKVNSFPNWKKHGNVLGFSQWRGRKFLKRKLSDLFESQNDTNQEDNTENQEPITNINWQMYVDDEADEDDDDDDVVIVANFGDIRTLIKFSNSFEVVKEEIDETFNLNPGSYKLEFKFDNGEWTRLNNDEDFANCIEVCRSDEMDHICVRMVPST